ncbi:hypothetical protein LP418_23710 [Nocardioides sp. B-3]|nr:hypothetical protein [Nocardioides sp. B-3]UUZ58986.1 hypothetical protein LP418_23710 [Nocardioides sp. B-3]
MAPSPGMDSLFGTFWPERPGLAGLRVVVACAPVGVLAGATMTFTAPGLSWVLVLLGAGTAAYLTARLRSNPFTIACTVLAALLVLPLMLLDAEGIALLGVFAAAGVFLIGVTGARTPIGFCAGRHRPAALVTARSAVVRPRAPGGRHRRPHARDRADRGRVPDRPRRLRCALRLGGCAVQDPDRRAGAVPELQRPGHARLRRLPRLRRHPRRRLPRPQPRPGRAHAPTRRRAGQPVRSG